MQPARLLVCGLEQPFSPEARTGTALPMIPYDGAHKDPLLEAACGQQPAPGRRPASAGDDMELLASTGQQAMAALAHAGASLQGTQPGVAGSWQPQPACERACAFSQAASSPVRSCRAEHAGAAVTEPASPAACVGVRVIWVAQHARRAGVATQLLDTLRCAELHAERMQLSRAVHLSAVAAGAHGPQELSWTSSSSPSHSPRSMACCWQLHTVRAGRCSCTMQPEDCLLHGTSSAGRSSNLLQNKFRYKCRKPQPQAQQNYRMVHEYRQLPLGISRRARNQRR